MADSVHIQLQEERGPCEASRLQLIDGGITLWRELECAAYSLRMFFHITDAPAPRIRISCAPALLDVRDYSHQFFAWDNCVPKDLTPTLESFNDLGEITARIFKPDSTLQEHPKLVSWGLSITPTRVFVERTLADTAYIQPRRFLTYEPLQIAGEEHLFGLWALCRCPHVIHDPPGRIDFSIQSNMAMDFFRWQFVLSSSARVDYSASTCTGSMCHLVGNANPRVGLPGWIPLGNLGPAHDKLVTTFYSAQPCFSNGSGSLVYRLQSTGAT